MLGHCSTAQCKGSDDAFDGTEELELHDETTVCDQVQHSLFRAVVEKLQYITGVRPDLMFVTKFLSYKLASPTLADLTRAKKTLRNLKADNTCIETERPEQDLETRHGILCC